MNHHFNLFRFYNESNEKEFIENNLSRAFSLCLCNNPLFFNNYIQSIVTPFDYDYLFSISSINSNSEYEIDLQIEMSTLDIEGIKKVYAIAMTSEINLDFSDFLDIKITPHQEKNITDIYITIKDIAFVIEVKRSGEDCKHQLYRQIYPFINHKNNPEIQSVNFPWQNVIILMEKVNNIYHLLNKDCVFIHDFLSLSESKYYWWFPSKPFNVLSFSSEVNTPDNNHLVKRMRQALENSDFKILDYNDRLGISVPFGWASELVTVFAKYDDLHKEYVVFYIWPGNTKTQGYSLYDKPLDWIEKDQIIVDGKSYELEICSSINLCHFNKYVSGFNYDDSDILIPLHTWDIFQSQSGKWNKNNWPAFEALMDKHLKPEFNWREKCEWDENFVNTDRNYFTISFGFEVALFIPFQEFKSIDKQDKDITNVANKINSIALALKDLI